jgi:hypothetical protein
VPTISISVAYDDLWKNSAAGRCRNLSIEIGLIGARIATLSALGGFFDHNARLAIALYFGFYLAFRIFVECLVLGRISLSR